MRYTNQFAVRWRQNDTTIGGTNNNNSVRLRTAAMRRYINLFAETIGKRDNNAQPHVFSLVGDPLWFLKTNIIQRLNNK